jgi:hypothetical protein
MMTLKSMVPNEGYKKLADKKIELIHMRINEIVMAYIDNIGQSSAEVKDDKYSKYVKSELFDKLKLN